MRKNTITKSRRKNLRNVDVRSSFLYTIIIVTLFLLSILNKNLYTLKLIRSIINKHLPFTYSITITLVLCIKQSILMFQ